jgi:tetratricopeptide (TPR) repeat protein
MLVRENYIAPGKSAPLILRRSTVKLSRGSVRELHVQPLLTLAKLLGVSYPEREWKAWSNAVPVQTQSMAAYLRGLGLLQSGSYEDAAAEFSIVIDPATDFAFAPAHVGLGDAYRLLGNRTADSAWELRARQAYQRAAPLDRDFGFAEAEKRWGELEAGGNNPSAAVEHLNAAIQLWPYDQTLIKALAAAYEAQKRTDDALRILQDAVTRAPYCWLTHNTLADFYARHGRARESETELLEVVRLAPDNSAAYGNLAFIYVKAGRFDDAIEMSSRAIAIRPHPIHYSTLGRAFLYRGCNADARLNLVKATEVGPEWWQTWTNLAEGLHATEPRSANAIAAYGRAIEVAAKYLEREPSDAHVRAEYALNLARAGRGIEAVTQAMRALQLGRQSHDVLLSAVHALELSGQRFKAIEILAEGLRTGLSVHEAEASFGLSNLRRDPRYREVLRRAGIDPATDPGGLIPRPPRGCPGWSVPGKGHKKS